MRELRNSREELLRARDAACEGARLKSELGGTIDFESQLGKRSRFWFGLSLGWIDNNGLESNEPRDALVYVKKVVSEIVIRRTLEKLGYRFIHSQKQGNVSLQAQKALRYC